MALRIVSLGTVTVTTAGTRVQISANDISAVSIIIQADSVNTGAIYVGDSTVDSNDFVLCPGQSIPLGGDSIRGNSQAFFLSDIYVDAENDGNIVRVIYVKQR